MPFQKGHKHRAKKFLERPLDKQPISFRGYEGQHAALKNVRNWQERLRSCVDKLIEEESLTTG